VGQEILCAVLGLDREARRVELTHRELLGTWAENAALFRPGMTVPGSVRGIKEYGAFVELTPNLSGLAECREGIREGDRVSVYLKSIQPERMKLKLLIIDRLPPVRAPEPPRYFISQGILDHWRYAPEGCLKAGSETVFRL
jgi:small subunit ribosomal protein S1